MCFSFHCVFFYLHLNINTRLNTFLQLKVCFVKCLRTFLSLSACFNTLEPWKYLNGLAENKFSTNVKQIRIKIEEYIVLS